MGKYNNAPQFDRIASGKVKRYKYQIAWWKNQVSSRSKLCKKLTPWKKG